MAIPGFPIKTLGPGDTKYNNDVIAQNGILTSIYGTNASDSVNNGLGYQVSLVVGSSNPNVIAGLIEATQIGGEGAAYVAELAMDERQRRGKARIIPEPDYYTLFNGVIIAARIQSIRSWLEVSGPAASQSYNGTAALNYNGPEVQVPPTAVTFPQAAVPSGAPFFTKSLGKITAANINALITELNTAGTVCTCNCNYCTCNCNYCTCNCNYSCTCNCNYSDENLKANVEYL